MNIRLRKIKSQEITTQNNQQEEEEKPELSAEFPAVKIAFYLLFFTSFLTRVWRIQHPGQVVFDEVHFGKFASYYLRPEFFFDVHPPLAKLMFALVGYLVGYEGSFLFEKIGMEYSEHHVPYVAYRLWSAFCGSLVVPLSFLILREIGVSALGCIFGSLLLVFDNALITQSRMILLDSMLMVSCTFSIYCWIRFFKQRHKSFSFKWWKWLSLTGFSLAIVLSIKMVGLFTLATIGVATLFDLWDILDVKRNPKFSTFAKHFGSRFLCLIVLPFVLYLIPYYLHFSILNVSGPGDTFMSIRFQSTLAGNNKTLGASGCSYINFRCSFLF